MKTQFSSFVGYMVLATALSSNALADNPGTAGAAAYYGPAKLDPIVYSDGQARSFAEEVAQGQAENETEIREREAKAKEEEKKKQEARKACEDAADKSGASAAEKAQKCPGAEVATPNPTSTGAKVKTAEAPKSFNDVMFSELAPPASGEPKITTLKTTTQSPGQMVANLNPDLVSKDSMFKGGEVHNSVTQGTRVQTTKVDAQAYRDRTGRATVAIGGQGLGFNPNANKYQAMRGGSVIWDDSLIKTDVETARATRFGQSELSPQGTNYSGFNQSVAVPDNLKKMGLTSAQLQMASYIDARGIDLGMPAEVRQTAIATAMRESRFNPFISANQNGTGAYKKYVDSSAYGLGQYLNGTWKGTTSLNRNNTVNQVDVLYGDINSRYSSYNANTSMQNKYSFAEYDYIHHYAGGFGASQDRIDFAVNYTRKNASANGAVTDYVMGGTSGGNIVAGGTRVPNYTAANSGLGSTVKQVLDTVTGGNANGVVKQLVTQALGGNTPAAQAATTALNQILNGETPSLDVSQLLAALSAAQGSGGGSGGGGDSYAAPTTNDAATPVKLTGYELIKAEEELQKCGQSLPSTHEAVMLMVARCKALLIGI